jgi:hypothetical protein
VIYAIESTQGLVRISAGWPSVASSYFDASSWKTQPGAQRALRGAVRVAARAVDETQGSVARTALDLLTGACVVVFDADSHARHAATLALRGRVDARRRTLIAGLAAVVDAALLVGAGATIDGTPWTPAMCAARIEREVLHVLDQCALDTEVGDGWADEGTLRAWVADRQRRHRER